MEEIANHSDTSVQSIETPIETSQTPTETNTPDTTQETSTGHRIKYNGEEKIISYDEAPTWIQKGMNYDKVAERAKEAETFQKNLDRIAKHYGFDSHDESSKRLKNSVWMKVLYVNTYSR